MTTSPDNTGRDPAKAGDTEAVKRGPNTIVVQARPNEEDAVTLARLALQPSVKGALTIKEYSKNCGDLDLMGLVGELLGQAKAANDGDLKRAEGLLMVQAHTLDAIFNELARRAALNMEEYLDATDRYLRLGLKAQSQCRATLETLAAIKNPPVVFARQANIAQGPQQVNNNAMMPAIEPRGGAGENASDKLSGSSK